MDDVYKLYAELKDCQYVNDIDIINIPLKSHIQYVNKISLKKKMGFLKKIKEDTILELSTQSNTRKWYIYSNENFIFYGDYKRKNKLKDQLLKLLNSDFSELRTRKTSISTDNPI